MRRNAEDLIVLSEAEPARRWSQPVPLVDVVRAALAEVEDYNRVELLPIDDIGVAGQAVSDVVHLLAELIENATSFSPPGTKVQVAGQQVSNGYVLEIEDRGLGMSDDELVEANERLANPPMVDFALSRMLGLYVVARLAQRYNIKVQLRHSWYGGSPRWCCYRPGGGAGAHARGDRGAQARAGRAGRLDQAGRAGGRGDRRAPPDLRGGRVGLVRGRRPRRPPALRRHAAQQPNGRAAEPRERRRHPRRCRRHPGAEPRRPRAGGSFSSPPRPDGQPEASGRGGRGRRDQGRGPAGEAMRVEPPAWRPPSRPRRPVGSATPGPRPGPAEPARTGPEPGPSRCRPGPRGVGTAAGRRQAVRAARRRRAGGDDPPPARSGRRADRGGADRIAGARPAAPPTRPTGPAPAPAPASPAPAAATLQAASVQTTKAGLPRGPAGEPAPGMVAARTAATAAPRRPPYSSQPSPSAASPRRRSGACCRATARASSAAG